MKTATTIILDNCDDLLQSDLNDAFVDLTQKLQKASKHIKFISTSRVQLTVVGVKHFPLGALGENGSSDLLQQECGKLQVEEMKAVADLVGHNPLGLRLAAKLACDVMTVKELIESLRANSVKTLSSETISDKQKMQFVIETSIKYLEKEVILCAKNISLFPGSFSKEAGMSVLSGCGVEDALYCLNTLSHKSLLEWYVVRGESRYKYHQLVRDSFNVTNLLKNCFNNDSTKEEIFFEQYSIYFTTHLMETLKECETGLSKHCEYWLHDEEHNIGIVLKAINQSSPSIAVEYLLYWSEIFKKPTLWKVYGAPNVLRLLHLEIEIIKHQVEQREFWDVNLFDIYLRFKTEWTLYFFLVGFSFSLLIPRFRAFLQSQEGHGMSAVDVVLRNVMTYIASFLASTTPALIATWLLLLGTSRAMPAFHAHDTLFVSPDELIYAFTLLMISGHFFLIFFHLLYSDIPPVPFSLFPSHSLISQSLNVMVKICDIFFPISFVQYLQFGCSLLPGPILFLSKVIIVLWFIVMVGVKSVFQPKSNLFLIFLVLSSYNLPSPRL